MNSTNPSTAHWPILLQRLRHVLLIERYGFSSGGVSIGKPVVVRTRTARHCISLGATVVPSLLREFPEIEQLLVWPTFRALIDAGGEPPDGLGAQANCFEEPLLDAKSEYMSELAQVVRRLVYLYVEEFCDVPVSHVMFSAASLRLRSFLDANVYLFETFLDSNNPLEKRLIRFLLSVRGVAKEHWEHGSDAQWLRRVAEEIEGTPCHIAWASATQLERFKHVGIIRVDFDPYHNEKLLSLLMADREGRTGRT